MKGPGVFAGALVLVAAAAGGLIAGLGSTGGNLYFTSASNAPPPTITYSCNQSPPGVCNFAPNTSIFAGMNNPYVTTYASLGSQVANNFNSPITGESQSISANSSSQWKVVNTTPTNHSGGITVYPSNGSNSYSGEIDDYSTLTTSYNLTMPIAGTGGTNADTVAWSTSDDWLMPPSTAQGPVGVGTGYEVQVHVDTSDSGTAGDYSCTGHVAASNVSIAGSSYLVCDYMNTNASGLCPGTAVNPDCGELVFVLGGGTYANKISTPTVSGTLNLLAIFEWMEANNVPMGFPGAGHPYMEPGSTLSGLSRGWEIVSTGGAAQTYTMHSFSAAATGTPTPPSTTPTFGAFTPNNTAHTCTLSWTGDANATDGYTGFVFGAQQGWLFFTSGTTSTVFTGPGTYNVELASTNSGGPGPSWGASGPAWNPVYEQCTVT